MGVNGGGGCRGGTWHREVDAETDSHSTARHELRHNEESTRHETIVSGAGPRWWVLINPILPVAISRPPYTWRPLEIAGCSRAPQPPQLLHPNGQALRNLSFSCRVNLAQRIGCLRARIPDLLAGIDGRQARMARSRMPWRTGRELHQPQRGGLQLTCHYVYSVRQSLHRGSTRGKPVDKVWQLTHSSCPPQRERWLALAARGEPDSAQRGAERSHCHRLLASRPSDVLTKQE